MSRGLIQDGEGLWDRGGFPSLRYIIPGDADTTWNWCGIGNVGQANNNYNTEVDTCRDIMVKETSKTEGKLRGVVLATSPQDNLEIIARFVPRSTAVDPDCCGHRVVFHDDPHFIEYRTVEVDKAAINSGSTGDSDIAQALTIYKNTTKKTQKDSQERYEGEITKVDTLRNHVVAVAEQWYGQLRNEGAWLKDKMAEFLRRYRNLNRLTFILDWEKAWDKFTAGKVQETWSLIKCVRPDNPITYFACLRDRIEIYQKSGECGVNDDGQAIWRRDYGMISTGC